MSATRIHPSLAIVLMAASAACDRMQPAPGHDFGLRVLGPSPIAVIGKVTVPVKVAVTGCGAFDASVVSRGAARHPVEFAQQPDGTFLATVPVEWLRDEDRTCLGDASAPLPSVAQVVVTCRDAGREAAADLAISYGTATRAYSFSGDMATGARAFAYPGVDPLDPFVAVLPVVGSNALLVPPGRIVPPLIDEPVFEIEPLARPRLITNGSRVFVSGVCSGNAGSLAPYEYCPEFAVSETTTVPSALLWSFDKDLNGVGWTVPAHVLDLAFAEDGAVVVLSEMYDWRAWPTFTAAAVTRVVPAVEGYGADVEIIGYFPREKATTRFSRTATGSLAFVTFVVPESPGPVHSALHTTDGRSVASVPDPTGAFDVGQVGEDGSYRLGSVQLAPDASALLVNGRYLGSADTSWNELPAFKRSPLDNDWEGAVWLTHSVALWSGDSFWWGGPPPGDSGAVDVFDAAPPHTRIYRYDVHPLPGSDAMAHLYGATAVGDRLVLTTNTGVRVIGPDGTLVGGSDPLPCGLVPTSIAVQTGPTTAAVVAGSYVYVFDLSD